MRSRLTRNKLSNARWPVSLSGTALLTSSDTAGTTLEHAQVTLAGVDGTLNQDSALGYELVRSLRELHETLRSLGSLADYLERNPNALIYGARHPSANGGR